MINSRRDLNSLTPEFQEKAISLLAKCEEKGVTLTPFSTLRGPTAQASLWTQGRTAVEIEEAATKMEKLNAPFLAKALRLCPKKQGLKVTNALPGFSWHQFAEAMDCYLVENGKVNWASDSRGYKVYAETAESLGLTAGYRFRSVDAVHVQLRPSEVKDSFLYPEIDEIMSSIYGGKDVEQTK